MMQRPSFFSATARRPVLVFLLAATALAFAPSCAGLDAGALGGLGSSLGVARSPLPTPVQRPAAVTDKPGLGQFLRGAGRIVDGVQAMESSMGNSR